MNNRRIADLVLIILLYCLYLGLVLMSKQFDLPSAIGVTEGTNADEFLTEFQNWALVGFGISLVAVLFWYVIGEWGPQPHATDAGSWMLFWLVGLLLAIAGGFTAFWFVVPRPPEGGEYLALFDIGVSLLFYYLATMLFSPVNVKYVVPGSRLFRRW